MSNPPTTSAPVELPESLRDRKQLALTDTFRFGCDAGLDCFTRCCGNINIFLTPVDVLRLARRLGIETGEFLDRYTLTPITKELHLPVKLLRMGDDPDHRCPLVGPDGCTVYEVRPWSCRMYPLGMAIPPARAGVEPEPIFFMSEDSICHGHGTGTEWTVQGWRENQGVVASEQLEQGFREIVAHPWFIGGRHLDPRQIEMFHTACYDLDAFRRFVFDTSFLERFELEPELVDSLRTDDDALLRFAFRWLRFALFGEPTMTKQPGAQPKGGRKS